MTATLTARRQTEKQFEGAVVDLARLSGWKIFHPFDSRRSESGWPDLAMVRSGVLVLAELKTDSGQLSRAQCDWLEHLGEVARGMSNVVVRCWRPIDWLEIERVLAR